jgi:Cu/Ag efflux protein CusF
MVRRSVFVRWMLAAPAAAALAGASPVLAQGSGSGDGEVTKIDKGAGRIEIRHGGIKALDMPPMRMAFRVRDSKMLDGLAVGDKVRFTAAKIDGQFTATAISKQ